MAASRPAIAKAVLPHNPPSAVSDAQPRLGAWEWNLVTGEITWSAACAALFGVPSGLLSAGITDIGGFLDLIHPEDRPSVEEALDRALTAGTPYESEFRIIRSDGAVRWLADKGDVLTDEGGKPARMIGILKDFTSQREAFERRHEREMGRVFASARCLLWHADVEDDGDELQWSNVRLSNDEAVAHTFLPVDWRDGETYLEASRRARLPEDDALTASFSRRMIRADRSYTQEFGIRLADGQVRWLNEDVYIERTGPGRWRATGVCTDVTASRLAQEALEKSAGLYRTLAETVPQLVWTSRPDGYVDYLNGRWYAYTGAGSGEHLGDGWMRALHPDDAPMVSEQWRRALRTLEPIETQYRLRSATGTYRWFLTRGIPLKGSDGEILKWFGTSTDISEKEEARREIQDLNERLLRAMRETHHRVKNNLQVVSALVDLQTMVDSDVVPKEDLKRLGQHIRALASIHDLLTTEARYETTASTLSARAALERLLPLLQWMVTGQRIEMEADDIAITIRQATAIALLTNEAVSNAVKHGGASVWVSLRRRDEAVMFAVEDDGPGFPEGFDPRTAANTGLDLMQSIVGWDLGGSVSFTNRPEGGACVLVEFPAQP